MVVRHMHLLQNEVLNKLDSIHNEEMMDGMEYQTLGRGQALGPGEVILRRQ